MRLKIAECSESTGITAQPCFSAVSFMRCHAITTVSLFASARVIPDSAAIFDGKSPAAPAIPFTITSGFVSSISLLIPSAPSLLVSVDLHPNSSASAVRLSSFLFAESPETQKSSGIFRTIFSVPVPIEPVQPSTTIFFILFRLPADKHSANRFHIVTANKIVP